LSVLDEVPGVDLLRCPTCAGPIDRETIFMCGRCGRHYTVEEGIPRMLDETVPGASVGGTRVFGAQSQDQSVDRIRQRLHRGLDSNSGRFLLDMLWKKLL